MTAFEGAMLFGFIGTILVMGLVLILQGDTRGKK